MEEAYGGRDAETLTGRCRTDVERLADRLNTPVQGTGADSLKLALALLWERSDECPSSVPVLVCHDEIVVECEERDLKKVGVWLKKAMEDGMDEVVNDPNVGGPQVRVEVEVESSRTWAG